MTAMRALGLASLSSKLRRRVGAVDAGRAADGAATPELKLASHNVGSGVKLAP